MIERLRELRIRSIVYLLSGKDSALALLLTRDIVKAYAEESKARVYMVNIVIPGNTHPLNTYAVGAVMLWHKHVYHFNPVFLCASEVFQEGIIKWGLKRGPRRWCFMRFKQRPLIEFERRLPRPTMYIDGMSPKDSAYRRNVVSAEIERIEATSRASFYAWHPLFKLSITDEEKLSILRRHEEFKPIVTLYEVFGDSLNCLVCPYKPARKYMKYKQAETFEPIHDFSSLALKSEQWLKLIRKVSMQVTLT